jgi:hypothetical protein
MKCKKCRKEIPDGSEYCLFCGCKQNESLSVQKVKSRGNGTGTVYKLPNGKWRAAVTISCGLDSDSGKVIQRRRTKTFQKKSDAVLYLSHLKDQTQRETRTLEALYDAFIKTKKYSKLSKSQQDKLGYAWNRCKDLRFIKISDLTLEQMQTTIDKEVSTFYPARDMKTLLSHLYTLAIQHNFTDRNPTEYLELPESEKSKKDSWKEEELQLFWDDYEGKDKDGVIRLDQRHEFTGYILIMCYAGLRYGELAKLPKENIHLDGQYMIGGIKTAAGIDRTIPIADKVLPIVRHFYNKNKKKLLEMNQDNFYNRYWDTIHRLGLRELSPHCCRHTYFTNMAEADIQPGVITAAGGHTSYQTTLGYTHISVKKLLEAVNKI